MNRFGIRYLFVLVAVALTCWGPFTEAAGQTPGVYMDRVVTQFFQRTTGWIASDGALSVALDDGRTLWLMGDSHIDDYDQLTGTIPCLFQVRNAALLQSRGSWEPSDTETLTGDSQGIKSLFKTTQDNNFWFWPGNGIQLKDTVYVYCSELERTGDGTFGFAGTGKDVWAKMKFPEMKVVDYELLPYFGGIHFGAGFIEDENSDYVYAYGQKLIPMAGGSEVYVARFPSGSPCYWEFWDGSQWQGDVAQLAVIGKGAISPHISKVKDQYLMLSTELSVACDQGNEIYASVSHSPVGPFSDGEKLYTIDDTLQGHYPFFYSVAAHPQFLGSSVPGSDDQMDLVVTYCINGYAPCLEPCTDGRANPDHYRPRGIRVPLECLRMEE